MISANRNREIEYENFPLDHYSYSSWVKFATNPFMFKINNINGDQIESTVGVSSILGSACHKALQTYFGGNKDLPTPANESEAITLGQDVGQAYMEAYSEGFIDYSTKIPTRAKLNERYAYSYFQYLKEFDKKPIKEILIVERKLEHRVEVDGKILPVKLQSYPDLVFRDSKGRVCIDDHKFAGQYSKDEIDPTKMVQAAFLYFTVYAETGEKPYSCSFREFKYVPNTDKSPQTQILTYVYEKEPLIFELFFRLYQDITDALLGKQVYVPNFSARYDKEVSILAYIHHLDVDEERAKAFESAKVDNITDFLKMRIQNAGAMEKYLKTVSNKFISANSLNYKDMSTEDKIKRKLAEHGLSVQFDSKIVGGAVTLYRYEPGIGLKMSKIESYAKDIEQVVEVSGIRILAPIPDSGLIGFEVPNTIRTFPTYKPINEGFNLNMGVDITGKPYFLDIRQAPHLLVAGSTGSGKSVFLNSLIHQFIGIENANLILLDPKMVELHQYASDADTYADAPEDIVRVLRNLVKEMNDRYKILKKLSKRNIEGTDLPYIFVILDEYGDLSNGSQGETVASSILLLAQKARAAGIHIILTTQRPSVSIVTGDIKANFPVRVAFKCSTAVDSHVIIDESGAEKLLGKGDMLLKTNDGIIRLQGYNI